MTQHTFLLVIFCLICPFISQPQSLPEVQEFLDDKQAYTGFMDFYYDQEEGKIYLVVDRLNEEFLYVNSLAAGVGSNDIGLDRGQLGNTRIVKFEKHGPRLLLIQPNYTYRAITDNLAERRAVEEAFARSVIWGFSIKAGDENKMVIDLTDFLMQDAHGVVDRLSSRGQGSYRLDPSRSALYLERTRNFPENTEFEATLTFTGKPSSGRAYINTVTPSASAVTVRQHHSFVMLPNDKFTPRQFDPRAGYFGIRFFDYSTPIGTPTSKRFISRHRLEKKNLTAEMSEPVEPIIYYLDPGTPEPVRSALLEGASWWNQAFEAAGYIDAFQVKMLPGDADPLDVRYNVIQWVHRSSRGWSYGASVTDPRTGEIIKGHVSLGSLRVRQDFLIAEGLLSPYSDEENIPTDMLEMALARIRQLSAHEVGHTLGLTHNFAASTADRASVMDYPHPLVELKNGELDLTNAYDAGIGEWDKIAIRYGYSQVPSGSDEKNFLNDILNEAVRKNIPFISDNDARPAGSAHPDAHLWDNGAKASDELTRIMEVREFALNQFSENNIRSGEPYASLEERLVPIYLFHRYQTEAAVKLIGGVHYSYGVRGQDGFIYETVSEKDQQDALEALLETLEPSALKLPQHLLALIPPKPLGYNRSRESFEHRTGKVFDYLALAETAAEMTTGLLLNPDRCTRLIEQQATGTGISLDELLGSLIEATWKSRPEDPIEREISRSVNMVILKHLFDLRGQKDSNPQVNAFAHHHILELKKWIDNELRNEKDQAVKAHLQYASSLISSFLRNPKVVEVPDTPRIPDGSPIGMDACTFR